MRSSWILGLVGVVAAACGGGGGTGAETLVAPAPTVAPEVAPLSASTVKVGAKLGLVYTANVLGELEPCG